MRYHLSVSLLALAFLLTHELRAKVPPHCPYIPSIVIDEVNHYHRLSQWPEHYDMKLNNNTKFNMQRTSSISPAAGTKGLATSWQVSNTSGNVMHSGTGSSTYANYTYTGYFPLRVKMTLRDKKQGNIVCNGVYQRILYANNILEQARNYTYLFDGGGEIDLKVNGEYVADPKDIPHRKLREAYEKLKKASMSRKGAPAARETRDRTSRSRGSTRTQIARGGAPMAMPNLSNADWRGLSKTMGQQSSVLSQSVNFGNQRVWLNQAIPNITSLILTSADGRTTLIPVAFNHRAILVKDDELAAGIYLLSIHGSEGEVQHLRLFKP